MLLTGASGALGRVLAKSLAAEGWTLKLTDIVKSGVYGVMGAGTGAVEIGGKLWVSSYRSDRIGLFPAK